MKEFDLTDCVLLPEFEPNEGCGLVCEDIEAELVEIDSWEADLLDQLALLGDCGGEY